jgi:hypothetical protein
MSAEILAAPPPGWPEWVDQDDFAVKDGRDPLGLETITTDRIAPLLVPGVLRGIDSGCLGVMFRRKLTPVSGTG